MTRPPGTQSATQRIPLSSDERAQAEVNFSPYVLPSARRRHGTVPGERQYP